LKELSDFEITIELLTGEIKPGKIVRKLKNSDNEEIAKPASDLYAKWTKYFREHKKEKKNENSDKTNRKTSETNKPKNSLTKSSSDLKVPDRKSLDSNLKNDKNKISSNSRSSLDSKPSLEIKTKTSASSVKPSVNKTDLKAKAEAKLNSKPSPRLVLAKNTFSEVHPKKRLSKELETNNSFTKNNSNSTPSTFSKNDKKKTEKTMKTNDDEIDGEPLDEEGLENLPQVEIEIGSGAVLLVSDSKN